MITKNDVVLAKYIDPKFIVKTEGNLSVFMVSAEEIVAVCKKLYFDDRLQLKTIAASDESGTGSGFRIFYIFGVPSENIFLAPVLELKNSQNFPSITKDIQEAAWYEQKIKTFFGLNPAGHPNLQPLLLHGNWPVDKFPLRRNFDWRERPPMAKNAYHFSEVGGEGIYEIPVGPVHAGVIEPGHFRFSVAGEEIVLLEPKLGYTHKGTEKLFEVLPLPDKIRLSERVSGDSSFSHSMAFCAALENLADVAVPARARYLRVVFSELERLANHLGDTGFIMQDTGYNFGGSNCARLRELVMRLADRLTGSRFLRGVNVLGGVAKDISAESRDQLLQELAAIRKDFDEVMAIAENSSSLLNRLEGAGKLDRQIGIDHGVLGVAARALGLTRDARLDYPYAAYNDLKFDPALENDGDVKARFYVRVKEIYSSFVILEQALGRLPAGEVAVSSPINFRKNSWGIGLVEGWRGDIFYFVMTDAAGVVSRVAVRDPSFLNWTVLGYAGKGNVVPDFPLINKSFNLSYSGYDL